jgi:hypothetical protein
MFSDNCKETLVPKVGHAAPRIDGDVVHRAAAFTHPERKAGGMSVDRGLLQLLLKNHFSRSVFGVIWHTAAQDRSNTSFLFSTRRLSWLMTHIDQSSINDL